MKHAHEVELPSDCARFYFRLVLVGQWWGVREVI